MSSPNEHPLVDVLLRVAKAAPRPWYFRMGLPKTPQNEEYVDGIIDILEVLHAEGLVERDSGTPATGPGAVLTPRGRQVVMDPEARKKLAQWEPPGPNRPTGDGRLITPYGDTTWEETIRPGSKSAGQRGQPVEDGPTGPDDIGEQVRASIQANLAPWVTRCLVFANVAVFLVGAYLAYQKSILWVYLSGRPTDLAQQDAYLELLHHLGSVNGRDLLAGEWWRMLSCSFLHFGGLHLLMNMWALWNIGAFVERIYGRWRTFVICLFGAWGCACLALAMTPVQQSGGASGVVSALLGGLGMWTLLVSHHLPKELAGSLRTQLIVNIVLMVLISLMPGVSAWGHAGGAAGGALAGLALHFGRFGSLPVRFVGYASLLGIAYLGWWYLDQQRETNPEWARVEASAFGERIFKKVNKSVGTASEAYQPFRILQEMHPTRRDPDKVQEAIEGLEGPLEELEQERDRLQSPLPFRSREVRKAFDLGAAYLNDRTAFYREAIRELKSPSDWTREDEKAHLAILARMQKSKKAWEGVPETLTKIVKGPKKDAP